MNVPLLAVSSFFMGVCLISLVWGLGYKRLTHFDRRFVQCGFTAEVDFVPGMDKVQCSLYAGHKTNYHEYWPPMHHAGTANNPPKMELQWRAR